MAKQIAYLIVSNGVDGRAPTSIDFASFDEEERDATFQNDKNKNFLRRTEEIVDVNLQMRKSLSKLDGIDKLVLGISK